MNSPTGNVYPDIPCLICQPVKPETGESVREYGSRQFIHRKLPKITQVNLTYPVLTLGSRKERKGPIETRHLKYLAKVPCVRTREVSLGMSRLMGSRRGAKWALIMASATL